MNPSPTPTVDVREADRRRQEAEAGGPLLIDVREPVEFSEVRAEGALLYPLSTFMARYEELPRDRSLLMICKSGARSAQATDFLLAQGWPDVANVAGGTLAWESAGLPVRRGAPAAGEGELSA